MARPPGPAAVLRCGSLLWGGAPSTTQGGVLPGDVVFEGGIAGFPTLPEDVGELQVGPLGAELGERDCGRHKVGRAGFEQVGQDSAPEVGAHQVDLLHAEFLGEIIRQVDRGPTAGFTAELVGDGVAAGAESSPAVAVAVNGWIVGCQDPAE